MQIWHAMMGTAEKEIQVGEDPILCSDFNKLMKRVAVGRQGSVINIFDVETMQLATTCQNTVDGHTNRVFCTKFDSTNPDILYSGSWDSYVLINDLREKKQVGSFVGPYVCGDCIDARDHNVLIGSYRSEDYLAIYDIRKFEKAIDINWSDDKGAKGFIYAAKWWQCKDVKSNIFLAGSAGTNDLKVFKQSKEAEDEGKYVEINHVTGISGGVLCLDITQDNGSIAYGT